MDTTVDTKINHHKENIGEPTQTQSGEGKHLHETVSCGNSLKEPQILFTHLTHISLTLTLKIVSYFYFMYCVFKKMSASMHSYAVIFICSKSCLGWWLKW